MKPKPKTVKVKALKCNHYFEFSKETLEPVGIPTTPPVFYNKVAYSTCIKCGLVSKSYI